jgi:hypothetical protein
MPKRDLVSEIAQYKERLPQDAHLPGLYLEYAVGLKHLIAGLDDKSPEEACMAREYVIVKLVAAVQAATRNLVRFVVSFKENRDLDLPPVATTVTTDFLRGFKRKNISLGDFIAHLYTVSSFEDVESTFKTVCDNRSLESATLAVAEFAKGKSPALRKRAYDDLRVTMRLLFSDRNIVCHEISAIGEPTEAIMAHFIQLASHVLRTFERQTILYMTSED